MKNDNNFLLVIIITIMVLMVYPMVMQKFFPQYFPDPERPSEQTQPSNTQTKQPVQTMQMAPIDTKQEAITYSSEKSYVLSNNLLAIEVNSPAADIKSIKFLEIKEPGSANPTVLLDTENLMPGVFRETGLTDKATLEDVSVGNSSIAFEYKKDNDLYIKKRMRLEPDMYKVALSYELKNKSKEAMVLPYRIIAANGIKKPASVESRFCSKITTFKDKKTVKKNINSKDYKDAEGAVELTGIMLRYFSLVAVPLVKVDYSYSYNFGFNDEFAPTAVGIGSKGLTIEPGQVERLDFVLYAGPNDHEKMSQLNLEVEQIRGKGFFAGLSDLMLLLLRILHKLFRNYGLAVIGLALTINLFLYPLTFKSLTSMKQMQAIQPHVEKLRNEHKDNPQKLNKEIMELYKKHKVNPVGGCLPMLIQMPIFFSLYGVLMRAIELRGAKFLWIKNLAAPDAFMSFPAKLPFLGSSLNILPLIMMVFSFLQQKATNPQHANEQQKTMALMMPIFLGVIFYNFPSGLVLYFLTNSIFSFYIQKGLKTNINLPGTYPTR